MTYASLYAIFFSENIDRSRDVDGFEVLTTCDRHVTNGFEVSRKDEFGEVITIFEGFVGKSGVGNTRYIQRFERFIRTLDDAKDVVVRF